ncbi:MAG: hypothetical protein OK404_02395 [Thaumarchaeota archaeon]|nr:hypothetical protein [Nitrososphaerota archaeon]
MILGALQEYAAALRSYRLPPKDLQALQERRLVSLISYAFNRVPYYHNLMRARHLSPDDISEIRDLQKLPMLTREIIQENSPRGMLARGIHPTSVRHTSGTTGKPLTIVRGPETDRRILALKLRRMHLTGVRWWEKAVYIPYWGSDVAGRAEVHGPKPSKMMKDAFHLPMRARDVVLGYRVVPLGPDNISGVARFVVRYRPSILRARPSYLQRTGRIIREMDPSFQVSKIFTEGELLTGGTRSDLQAIYGAEVYDEYGSAEFSGLGFECRQHDGIHLYSDYFAFEFIGRDGQPAEAGEAAELLVTGLVDDAMPLIRYRLGDRVVRQEGGVCGCGSYLPRLKSIEGRMSDGLIIPGRDMIAPGSVIQYLENTLGLRRYQMVQEGDAQVLLRVDKHDLNEATVSSVREYLQFIFGGEVTLRTELWDEKEMPIKFRQVMRAQTFALKDRVNA